MFRRIFALTCALMVAGALSWGAAAAPISGSFAVDIVFYPQHDEEDPIKKVDKIDMKFEADLILTLSISGVDITSTTVFTFRGLEFQSFVINATVGALTIRDTIIFAPTIFEFEELRDQFGRLQWCINYSAPTPPGNLNVAGRHENCDFPNFTRDTPDHFYGGLNAHIDDPDFGTVYFDQIFGAGSLVRRSDILNVHGRTIHPLAQNLVLARWIEGLGGLANVLRFRKKIADLSLNIAGLVLGVKALFANRSQSPTGFDPISGLVLTMEGKTVSGIGVRGELWLGAKQGLECFGECKPLERFYNAKVTGGGFNNTEEEKVFLSNVMIAGIRHDFRAEFHFELRQCSIDQYDDDSDGWFGEDPVNGVDDDGDGLIDEDPVNVTSPICFVQLTQSGVIAPWKLSFSTTWNFNGALDLLSNLTTLRLKAGDVSVAAVFIWWQSAQYGFNTGLANFVSSFDPPGLKVISDIIFCTDIWLCDAPNVHQPAFLPPVIEHVISFSGAVGAMSIAASVRFDGGVFGTFEELDVDMSFSAGAVTVVSSTVLLTDMLGGQGISLIVKF